MKSLECSLLLRLEGKCSIPSISDMLKRMGLENNSVGTISKKLNEIGEYLLNTFYFDNDAILYVHLAVDKIIQSSAIVENINSIVRTFLNTSRNRINQEMANTYAKIYFQAVFSYKGRECLIHKNWGGGLYKYRNILVFL